MKQKKFKFTLMIAILPMLIASCNDEPTPPPPPTEKPIIFETKSMFWETDYDAVTNTYNTYCVDTQVAYGGHSLAYKFLDGADNPNKLCVTEFTIEVGDETRVLDISKIKEQANESSNGFFEVQIEGIYLKYTSPGEFVVSYAPESESEFWEMISANIESKFYNIKLEGDNNYKTTIRIEDGFEKTAGPGILAFDLSGIKYPTDRGYDHNGAKCGGDYYVYLPAESSSFSLISSDEYNGKHFYIIKTREKHKDDTYTDLPMEVIEEVEKSGAWYYVVENAIGKFTHKEDYKLECEIKANNTGKERVFEFDITKNREGWANSLMGATLIVIQAAE